MALHTAYKATCKDDRGIVRWYFGITRVDAGQSAIGAVAARRRWCEALPVSHFKTGLLETLKYTPLGHLLKLEHALAEEALLTAEAMRNRELGHCFVRGGPWHGWQLGYKNNEESHKVAGISFIAGGTTGRLPGPRSWRMRRSDLTPRRSVVISKTDHSFGTAQSLGAWKSSLRNVLREVNLARLRMAISRGSERV